MNRRAGVLDHLAFALVIAVVVLGFVLIASYRWRRGATLIGGGLLLAAGLRAVVPDGRAGLLAIRGRTVDVLAYTCFGLALVAVAVTID
ncbi:MAG TPA: DUF3017 domain-containing protein [Pseudonocardiaceae bacterium]